MCAENPVTARYSAHAVYCDCPECCERARARAQHLTSDPPMKALADNAVSTREISDYVVLGDWADD